MIDPIAPIHLYKLTTGESVIGFFFGDVELNGKLNLHGHLVTRPMLVNRFYELEPWVIGLNADQKSLVIPISTMIVIAEQEIIDLVLIDIYMTKVGLNYGWGE